MSQSVKAAGEYEAKIALIQMGIRKLYLPMVQRGRLEAPSLCTRSGDGALDY